VGTSTLLTLKRSILNRALSKQGKDIVFRFIIEYIYSSLMDFYRPLGR
jgi:hypothetical protein